ncbi:MAG TPA: redoxin domain-containing protein [Methylomirabilota bacterium]|nr:redoxin domain-containing protein [Methylomirabilota bacterium]
MLRLTALVPSDAMSNTTPIIILTAVLLVAGAGTAMGDDEMLEPGQHFPAFELPAHDGTIVSRADLDGSTYLLFYYPKADTGG